MKSLYQKLALVISINTVLMFLITYVMIDSIDHCYFNINRVYMALLMAAPMVVLMLLVMRSMYQNKKLNGFHRIVYFDLFIHPHSDTGRERTIPALDDPPPFRGNINV